MPRDSPQEPLCHAEHQTRTPALVRQIRHDHSFYPNRCRTGAGARSDDCGAATIALNNRIGSSGVPASAKSRKIRGTGPALWQPLPMGSACARKKEKMAKGLSSGAEIQMQETGHVRWGASSWDKIPILSFNTLNTLRFLSFVQDCSEAAVNKKNDPTLS